MGSGWYTLAADKRTPVLDKSGIAGRDLPDDAVIVARTYVPERKQCVSTVFLRLDHRFGDGPPLLWETMVFPAGDDGEPSSFGELYCDRYSTRDDAETGHAETVAKCKAGLIPEKDDE